jgi:hypothetical protein
MMTDKTVHAENEDFFHGEFLNVNVGLCRMTQSDCDQAAPVNCFNSLTGIGFPSQCNSIMRNALPSPHTPRATLSTTCKPVGKFPVGKLDKRAFE